ncbi:MAG: glycosyltransferase [Anaerolineales bacterium]|nr:glycosyltransferase [Anaerolineales bacterium]
MNKLPFSIITPCFNRVDLIAEAVESVLQQDYPDFEHIIVDGGSTDGTLEVLSRYPHLRVISEPDEGIYDAINKGLRLARGEVIGWLNTDDLYPPGTFTAVAKAFNQHPGVQAVMGSAEWFEDRDGERLRTYLFHAVRPHDVWLRVAGYGTTAPNAWFIHRDVYRQVGEYNTAYHLAADREFLFRVALTGLCPDPVDQVVYQYRRHADSATFAHSDSRAPEQGRRRLRALEEELGMLVGLMQIRPMPLAARQALVKTHSERSYRLVATALYHRFWKQALRGAVQAIRRDLLWPLVFFQFAFRRVSEEFREHD